MNYEKLELSGQNTLYEKHNSKHPAQQSIELVINGNLDEKLPRQEDFVGLHDTTLRNHQKTLLYHMIQLENNSIKPSSRFSVSSNIGVVGDVVGAGKSLPTLLLIHNSKTFNSSKDKYYTYNKTCSVSVVDHTNTGPISNRIYSSILVVPHTLVRQWRTYADNYVPDLQYKVINKKSHLKLYEDDDSKKQLYKNIAEFINAPLIIVSSTFFSQFMNVYIGGKSVMNMNYDRIIFDEADTIHIPNCYRPTANFYWFITSSIINLMLPLSRYYNGTYIDGIKCTGFIKNVFTELEQNAFPFYHLIFFKNKDAYIQSSFELPKPNIKYVTCFTPPAVKVLKGILDDKVIQMLQGDDLKGAMEQVGSMNLIKSTDDIIKISTTMLNKDLQNKQKEFEYKSGLTYATTESKQHALENIQHKINEIRGKIKLIENRVQNKFCTVCTSDAVIPTITMCCKNVFCLSCIQSSFEHNPICPFCRAKITKDSIKIQSELSTEEKVIDLPNDIKKVKKLPNKVDTMLKIIKEKPAGKFLIVSLYENSLNELAEKLSDNDIITAKLSGNNLVVNKTLTRFKDPSSNLGCILLNALHYGSGLNIPEATDIIIYHKLSKELEVQVIGRAQRFGRVGSLNIHYLQTEGEYD
jgi:hypothetical protein